MAFVLTAFSLLHLCAGVASLVLAVRLLTPEERALWRSKAALLAAELLCWVYPIAALASSKVAWRAFNAGEAHAVPMILTPLLWLLTMGVLYALVDFFEDGVLGNARTSVGREV